MAQYSSALEQRQEGIGTIWLLPVFFVTLLSAGSRVVAGRPEDIRALVILLLLTPLTFLIIARAARTDADGGFLHRVLLLGWAAKLAAMEFKLYLAKEVLGGAPDATRYHTFGSSIAALLAQGGFPHYARLTSTEFVELLTGFFYFFVTGPTFVGAWIVWSWLAFLGMLAHYKAFVTALPTSSRRWFAVLILFSPTLLIWPASLGKDALIAFTLGLTAYGVALLVRRGVNIATLFWIVAGLGGTFVVRSAIAAIASVGLVIAGLLRPIRAGFLTPLIRVGTFAAVIIFSIAVVRFAVSDLHFELTVESVEEFYETQSLGTQQGSLAFQGTGSIPTTPTAIAVAVATVLFRPFPWEAVGVLALGIALEGLALVAVVLYRWRSVWAALREIRRHAYLGFVTAYAVIFIVAFSAISNFGILARQRAQLLPFLFVLIAYQGWPRRKPLAGSGP